MRVAGARRERRDGAVVVGARFEWEDAEIAPVELEFAGEGAAAEHLLPDANAFLLAAAFPAARRGERRIALEGAVCPVLRDGLATAARILDGWYGGARRIPTIEPSGGFRAPFPPPRRSASFLSGGVDSVELLLTNRAQFGSDHPASIRDVLLLDGFPLACPGGSDARRNHSERALRSAGAVAAAAGAPLTRVSTNLAALESDFGFSEREWYGAAFAAVAHLFSSRFSSVALASDYALSGAMPPNGSHPLLDPLYGSASLAFVHAGTESSRLEKVRALARHPEIVDALLVCAAAPIGQARVNCGACEKCVRTRLELLAAGVASTSAFPGVLAPSIGEIARVRLRASRAAYWKPLVGALRALGLADLAAAGEAKIAESVRLERWIAGAGWKRWIRRTERRLFAPRAAAS